MPLVRLVPRRNHSIQMPTVSGEWVVGAGHPHHALARGYSGAHTLSGVLQHLCVLQRAAREVFGHPLCWPCPGPPTQAPTPSARQAPHIGSMVRGGAAHCPSNGRPRAICTRGGQGCSRTRAWCCRHIQPGIRGNSGHRGGLPPGGAACTYWSRQGADEPAKSCQPSHWAVTAKSGGAILATHGCCT